MSTFVVAYSYSVTYVADQILRGLQDIVRQSGLDPRKISDDWRVLERGLATWLTSRDLEEVVLEVYDQASDGLVGRWDFTITYDWTDAGSFWVDTDQIYYAIRKQGLWPRDCSYRVVVSTRPGRPDVPGWNPTTLRSTEGFVRHSIGTNIDAGGLGARASYYRKK